MALYYEIWGGAGGVVYLAVSVAFGYTTPPFPNAEIHVGLLTYALAQYLIMDSYLLDRRSEK